MLVKRLETPYILCRDTIKPTGDIGRGVNRFNLTFKGEILLGRKPEQVKLRFGEMFAINDPVRLERFFSGQTVILRRNLDRKEAAEHFQMLRKLGVETELVKVTTEDAAAAIAEPPPPAPEFLQETAAENDAAGAPGQTWAVSSSTVRRAAELAEKKRREAEEAARQELLREEAARKAAEEAARQKLLREEAERKAAEEAARQKLLHEEAERKAAEEAARQKLLREEAERKAAEEAARRKAELAEKKRREAEEAARIKAEQRRQKAAEQARLKEQRAAEAARQQALQAEAKRKAAEQAAKHKAELAQKKRIEAQEAARLKAELAEKKRKAVEEAARKQAIVAEAKRKAATEAARLKAEQEEQARKAAAELALLRAEQRRREAEREANIKAEREAKAQQQREKEQQQQGIAAAEAAAKQTLHEEEKRKAAAQLAKKKAAKAKEKHQQAENAARRKATEQRHKEERQAQLRAEQEEQAAQRKSMEEQAEQRAVLELAQQPSLKPVKARVKTNLEVPQRQHSHKDNPPVARRPKRQSGEPNLYSLRPFRNTPEVRARAELSQQRMRLGFTAATLALAGLLILGGLFLGRPPAQTVTGANALAIDAQGGPLLLAGDSLLLHDRSGVGTSAVQLDDLGLTALQGPLAIDAAGELFALGRLAVGDQQTTGNKVLQLLRCKLQQSLCLPFSTELANSTIAGFAIHPLDGTVLLADAAAGQLLRADPQGTVLARAAASIPENPVLRLQSGLLFMNSATGPAVSVFRYDDSAFGQQLDEILLLPPAAMVAEQSQVRNFLWSADAWWVSMYNPQTNSAGLYRFDAQWNFTGQAQLPANTLPGVLATWGEKTLVGDAGHLPIQRFNSRGAPEAPLVSDLLEKLVNKQQRHASFTGLAWRVSLLLCALVAVTGICLGNLQRLRGLVYKPHRERGAAPVDEYAEALYWINPVNNRKARLQRTGLVYAAAALAMSLLAIGQSVTVMQLTALLIALSGPAVALLLLGKTPIGHLGVAQQQLLLVDHTGMYHLGSGPSVQYRGPFLLIDDVVVFTGVNWLPTFSNEQVQSDVMPLASGGIKVDRNTVVVKLLQCRHPLAQGGVVILAALTAAAVLLCLPGLA